MTVAKGLATEPSNTQILPRAAQEALAHDRLQSMQDELLERSLSILDSTVRFSEIDKGSLVPPKEWVEELGMERAMIRLRVANAAWENAKEAPVGIKVAAQVAVGILKAQAQKDSGPKVLNVQFVKWSTPLPVFPEREFEPER